MMTTSAAGNKYGGSADKGFTLLELLIVVLIAVLVLSVSYPLLSRSSSSVHLRTAGRDVLNIFRHAREKAVTEQVGMKLTVDRENQWLVLDNLRDYSRSYRMPQDVRIHRMAMAGREVFENSMVVRFLPNGSSENAAVLLRLESGASLKILSDPLTGGARIEESSQGEDLP